MQHVAQHHQSLRLPSYPQADSEGVPYAVCSFDLQDQKTYRDHGPQSLICAVGGYPRELSIIRTSFSTFVPDGTFLSGLYPARLDISSRNTRTTGVGSES